MKLMFNLGTVGVYTAVQSAITIPMVHVHAGLFQDVLDSHLHNVNLSPSLATNSVPEFKSVSTSFFGRELRRELQISAECGYKTNTQLLEDSAYIEFLDAMLLACPTKPWQGTVGVITLVTDFRNCDQSEISRAYCQANYQLIDLPDHIIKCLAGEDSVHDYDIDIYVYDDFVCLARDPSCPSDFVGLTDQDLLVAYENVFSSECTVEYLEEGNQLSPQDPLKVFSEECDNKSEAQFLEDSVYKAKVLAVLLFCPTKTWQDTDGVITGVADYRNCDISEFRAYCQANYQLIDIPDHNIKCPAEGDSVEFDVYAYDTFECHVRDPSCSFDSVGLTDQDILVKYGENLGLSSQCTVEYLEAGHQPPQFQEPEPKESDNLSEECFDEMAMLREDAEYIIATTATFAPVFEDCQATIGPFLVGDNTFIVLDHNTCAKQSEPNDFLDGFPSVQPIVFTNMKFTCPQYTVYLISEWAYVGKSCPSDPGDWTSNDYAVAWGIEDCDTEPLEEGDEPPSPPTDAPNDEDPPTDAAPVPPTTEDPPVEAPVEAPSAAPVPQLQEPGPKESDNLSEECLDEQAMIKKQDAEYLIAKSTMPDSVTEAWSPFLVGDNTFIVLDHNACDKQSPPTPKYFLDGFSYLQPIVFTNWKITCPQYTVYLISEWEFVGKSCPSDPGDWTGNDYLVAMGMEICDIEPLEEGDEPPSPPTDAPNDEDPPTDAAPVPSTTEDPPTEAPVEAPSAAAREPLLTKTIALLPAVAAMTLAVLY